MPLKPHQINTFILFKLPAAFFCGVRVKLVSNTKCITTVRHRWINQNPFKSIYWAVQGMAAELSTGALVMNFIKESNLPISMLVVNNKATFLKKARGKITFSCEDGNMIDETITTSIHTNEGQTCWMKSVGIDQHANVVSIFEFEWSVRIKNQ